MKALFFPCTLDGLPPNSGSAVIRCEWVAKYWPGATIYRGQPDLGAQDLYVFQKVYRSERVRAWISLLAQRRDEGGGLLAFDLCDPDFLDEHARETLLDVLPAFDFAVAPNARIVQWLSQYLPAYVVDDGVDPEAIVHRHVFDPNAAGTATRICWIGYKGNTGALNPLVEGIQALGVMPHVCVIERPLTFERWLEILTQYDVVLNPQPDVPPYCYKSDNKSKIAWTAGVAVARTVDELAEMLDPDRRLAALTDNHARVETAWHARHSANRWSMLARNEEASRGPSNH